MTDHATAQRVIDELTALDGYDEQAVLTVLTGIGRFLFLALDGKPGQFDGDYNRGDWHWKLRRARNNASGLFACIDQGRTA